MLGRGWTVFPSRFASSHPDDKERNRTGGNYMHKVLVVVNTGGWGRLESVDVLQAR